MSEEVGHPAMKIRMEKVHSDATIIDIMFCACEVGHVPQLPVQHYMLNLHYYVMGLELQS